jgi:hypothetical protein
MKSIKRFFAALIRIFSAGASAADKMLNIVLRYIPDAMEIVEIVATLTPTAWDDVALAAVRAKYPRLFDPDATEAERKAFLLGVAGELLKLRYPSLTTTMARLAAQAAYALRVASEWLAKQDGAE